MTQLIMKRFGTWLTSSNTHIGKQYLQGGQHMKVVENSSGQIS